MAEKVIQTRIINKHGSVADWLKSDLVLKEGEIALAYVNTAQESKDDNGKVTVQYVPTYLMKVGHNDASGNGQKFSALPWVHAPASDVYAWAKKANLALSDIPMADVKTNLQDTFYTETEIDTKLASLNTALGEKAPSNHTHGNITNGGALNTASRVVITDASKKITISDITTEELGRLDGVTSNIQTQLDGKAAKATTLAGYGITNAYTKGEVDSEVSALEIAIGKKADSGHNHDSVYIKPADVDTKIAAAVSSVLKYKGTVAKTSNLPTADIATGDVYNITDACAANTDVTPNLPKVNAGDNVAWNGTGWDVLAGTVDLSSYTTKSYVDSELAKYQPVHDHPYLPDSTKYAGSATQGGAANSVANSITVQLNSGTKEGTDKFTFNGEAAKTINITPSAIGASASGHTHDDRYYTEGESDSRFAPIGHTHTTTIAASSGTNELTLAHGAKYAITAGGDSFVFTMPSDNNTHYTNYLQIKGNGTEAIKYTQDNDKSLNLKPGTNVSISAASGEITISAPNVYTKSEVDSKIGAIFNEIVFDCGGPND